MRCPSCGAKCKSGRTACPKCGVPFDPKVAAYGGAARGVRATWGLAAEEETGVAAKGPVPRAALFAIAVLALVAVLLAVVLVLQQTAGKPQERALDTANFADEGLVAVLAAYDVDGDGALSVAEAAAVEELDCSGAGLRSLDGIELFLNLRVLNAQDNSLTSVDLTGLDKLERVNLSNNALATLDLSGHTALTALNVSDNALTALDVSSCTALASLLCSGNAIARLDLATCTALSELACDDDQNVIVPISTGFFPDEGLRQALAAFDTNGDGALGLRERDAVSALDLSDKAIADLTGLAWFGDLATLDISSNALISLVTADLPPSLTTLTAADCQIATVDLTGAERLTALDLSGNAISSIDLSPCTRLASVTLANCALSGTLDVTLNTRLTHLDVTGNPALASVTAIGVAGLAAEGAVERDGTCALVLSEAPADEAATTDTANADGTAANADGETAPADEAPAA